MLAKAAKSNGALVIAVVTTPFPFEGAHRHKQAQAGLQNLRAAEYLEHAIPRISAEPNGRLQQLRQTGIEVHRFGGISDAVVVE